MRYNGSIKGAQNKASLTSAPGVWTINDVQENALIETWPGSDIEYDYFDFVVVGGGGGGGGAENNTSGGGGGAGGYREGSRVIIPSTDPEGVYAIGVGDGGSYGSGDYPGLKGGLSYITCPHPQFVDVWTGGGGGGKGNGPWPISSSRPAGDGGIETSGGWAPGSGGGADTYSPTLYGNNSPPGSGPGDDYSGATQGGRGGGSNSGGPYGGGGGGGGAGSPGFDATGKNGTVDGNGGDGGVGYASDITGTLIYRAAGGGGGGNSGGQSTGGTGGGGNGGYMTTSGYMSFGTDGQAGTGSGGGGGVVNGNNGPSDAKGGDGGPGTVIIRYPDSYELVVNQTQNAPGHLSVAESGTVSTPSGSKKYIVFWRGSVNNGLQFRRVNLLS